MLPCLLSNGSQMTSKCEKTKTNFVFDLPPFSLIRDFGKQNTHGNVSKNFRQSCVLLTARF